METTKIIELSTNPIEETEITNGDPGDHSSASTKIDVASEIESTNSATLVISDEKTSGTQTVKTQTYDMFVMKINVSCFLH